MKLQIRYLIDAYNLLFRYRKKKGGSLQEMREQLVAALAPLHLDLTLVFDGQDECFSHPLKTHVGNIAIVYTAASQTADEYILSEVELSSRPDRLVVVSNDSELICKSALHGAQVLSLKEFVQLLEKKQRKKISQTQELQDSPKQIARLIAIFEKQLEDELE